jgi:hypothetical protein
MGFQGCLPNTFLTLATFAACLQEEAFEKTQRYKEGKARCVCATLALVAALADGLLTRAGAGGCRPQFILEKCV